MFDRYDFKWKLYPDHLVKVFKELGEEGNFADVTLVSDDQVQTPAHKVVLSACSPLLKTLLVNNPHSHPLLYLRGIKQTELQAILKFMYFGETQIFEKGIEEFINVAKDLQLKEINSVQNSADEPEAEFFAKQANKEVQENVKEYEVASDDLDDQILKEILKSDSHHRADGKPRRATHSSKENQSYGCQECGGKFSTRKGLLYHKRSKHEGIRYECGKCDLFFTDKSSLRVHRQSKHEGVNFLCSYCDYQAATQGDINRHKNAKHLGVRYPCSQCDYRATQQASRENNIKNTFCMSKISLQSLSICSY